VHKIGDAADDAEALVRQGEQRGDDEADDRPGYPPGKRRLEDALYASSPF
jgi:hypothetical protein